MGTCERCNGTGTDPKPTAADVLCGELDRDSIRDLVRHPDGTAEYLCRFTLPDGRKAWAQVTEWDDGQMPAPVTAP